MCQINVPAGLYYVPIQVRLTSVRVFGIVFLFQVIYTKTNSCLLSCREKRGMERDGGKDIPGKKLL